MGGGGACLVVLAVVGREHLIQELVLEAAVDELELADDAVLVQVHLLKDLLGACERTLHVVVVVVVVDHVGLVAAGHAELHGLRVRVGLGSRSRLLLVIQTNQVINRLHK